jgi:hypothetical protein
MPGQQFITHSCDQNDYRTGRDYATGSPKALLNVFHSSSNLLTITDETVRLLMLTLIRIFGDVF